MNDWRIKEELKKIVTGKITISETI